jgi:hypothetical protein
LLRLNPAGAAPGAGAGGASAGQGTGAAELGIKTRYVGCLLHPWWRLRLRHVRVPAVYQGPWAGDGFTEWHETAEAAAERMDAFRVVLGWRPGAISYPDQPVRPERLAGARAAVQVGAFWSMCRLPRRSLAMS